MNPITDPTTKFQSWPIGRFMVSVALTVLVCSLACRPNDGPEQSSPIVEASAVTPTSSGLGWVLDTSPYPPRWQCGEWTSAIGWLHILSDLTTWLAYVAIPAMLIYFARKRGGMPFNGLFFLFCAFIVSCGAAHLMEAAIFWWPAYGLAGILKLGTALTSTATVVALFFAIPKALAFRSPAELEEEVRRRTSELELAHQQANRIIEASPVGMIMVDDRGTVVLANQQANQLFGYTRQELQGMAIEMLVPEQHRASHIGHREQFFNDPSTREMGLGRELFGVHKSGEEIPVEVGLNPIPTSGGIRVLCSVLDLRERRHAAAELRRHAIENAQLADDLISVNMELENTVAAERGANAKLRGVIDNSTNFVGILGTDGVVLDANRTALAAAGINAGDVVDQPFWMTPWWTHSQRLQERLRLAIRSAAAGKEDGFEATHPTPDGSLIYIDFSLKPVSNDKGEVLWLIPEGRDITQHKQREAELLRLNRIVVSSNQELEQFAYVASHDLQEPLRKMSIHAQLVLEENGDQLDDDGHACLAVVIDGAARLKALVTDLLMFSRINSHGDQLVPANSQECLDVALNDLGLLIEEAHAEITIDALPHVVTDPNQLSMLFQNLISNAIKYCEEEPRIHIGGRDTGNEFEFFVRDNGIGIEPQYFERVFEIFKRLHARHEYSGTGIGLANCKRIVERCGGTIWVTSDPGVGSTFYFTLKKTSSNESAASQHSAAAAGRA